MSESSLMIAKAYKEINTIDNPSVISQKKTGESWENTFREFQEGLGRRYQRK